MNAIRHLVSRFSCCSLVLSLVGACDTAPKMRVDGAQDRLEGTTVTLEQRPWHVSVQKVGAEQPHTCAGSIVANQWVLTAAHCIDIDEEAGEQLQIVAGVTNLGETDGQTRAVDEIVIHPHFKAARTGADLAMLHLAEPLELAESPEQEGPSPILPITQAELDALTPGTTVVATGWSTEPVTMDPAASDPFGPLVPPSDPADEPTTGSGTTGAEPEPEPEPEIVGQTIVSVRLEVVASQEIRDDYDTPLVKDQMAARPVEADLDACSGHEGGSLVVEAGAYWRLVGVDSFDVGCELDGELMPPRVYTQPTSSVAWIHDVLNRSEEPASTPDDSCETRCGLRAPSGCRCDALCIDDGSCCEDFVDQC